MKIVFASANKNKIREIQTLMREYLGDGIEVLSLADIGFFDDIEETGETFAENALIKAKVAAGFGYIALADDSGLSVEALDGAPGVYSARYCGHHGSDEENNAKLLNELKGVSHRNAAYICAIACAFPDGREPIITMGDVQGEILVSPRGKGGFGYDPLFWYDPYGKTFAEITAEEKNAISHRAKAVARMCANLAPIIKEYESK
ncbi:MAG: XTP/dITP diphosphatase [Clostridia bacterium]|nr:XTP/dITP diphosphatase [Clostridia bacterium]